MGGVLVNLHRNHRADDSRLLNALVIALTNERRVIVLKLTSFVSATLINRALSLGNRFHDGVFARCLYA